MKPQVIWHNNGIIWQKLFDVFFLSLVKQWRPVVAANIQMRKLPFSLPLYFIADLYDCLTGCPVCYAGFAIKKYITFLSTSNMTWRRRIYWRLLLLLLSVVGYDSGNLNPASSNSNYVELHSYQSCNLFFKLYCYTYFF